TPAGASFTVAGGGYDLEMEPLEGIDAEIVEGPTDEDGFIKFAQDADAIYAKGMRFTKKIIDALPQKCRAIVLGSVGVDSVDVKAATERGIPVTNCPDTFIEEVADHAMMLLLDVARLTPMMSRMARDGEWYQARPILSRVPRLLGQTLGLFAFGNVARCTARRAQAFGLRVIACDPYVSELEITAAGVEPVGFAELLERSDYLSVHAPHNDETEHAINATALARMKPTAVVINTARGNIIDEVALIEALQTGIIAGAGLDVLEQEPPSDNNPLLTMENVVVTPHVASATTRMRPETRRRVGREVALVLRGKWPMSCVNPTVLPRVALERWQPYPMSRGPNR
ncbi:MAG TPA: C-terminal binding protein, partial [Caulobacteraceae bacterium]|nr:C-terminal binding protein [Caulobacteraceae bacterium]